MRDGNSFPFVCVVLMVILACKSIVLCMCSGNRIIGYIHFNARDTVKTPNTLDNSNSPLC